MVTLHEIHTGFPQYAENFGIFNELGDGSLPERMRDVVDRRHDRPVGGAIFHTLNEVPVDFHEIDREVL